MRERNTGATVHRKGRELSCVDAAQRLGHLVFVRLSSLGFAIVLAYGVALGGCDDSDRRVGRDAGGAGGDAGGRGDGGARGDAGGTLDGGGHDGGRAGSDAGSGGDGGGGGMDAGGDAGPADALDPRLATADPSGEICATPGSTGECAGIAVCRFYDASSSRCESCEGCGNLGQPCTTGADCDILFACFDGRCTNICPLGTTYCGPVEDCLDVGHPTHGVCRP